MRKKIGNFAVDAAYGVDKIDTIGPPERPYHSQHPASAKTTLSIRLLRCGKQASVNWSLGEMHSAA